MPPSQSSRAIVGLKMKQKMVEKQLAMVEKRLEDNTVRQTRRERGSDDWQQSSRQASREALSRQRDNALSRQASRQASAMANDQLPSVATSRGGGDLATWRLPQLRKYKVNMSRSSTEPELLAPSPIAPWKNEKANQLAKRNCEINTRQQMRRKKAELPVLQSSPQKAGAYLKHKIPPTLFVTMYKRGELPCAVEHRSGGNVLKWYTPFEELDIQKYLRFFFDGLREIGFPYDFIAHQGTKEILEYLQGKSVKAVAVLPTLVEPIRTNCMTRHPDIVAATLKSVQTLLLSNKEVGQHLVPFYNQILGPMNLFKNWRQNLGDKMDYSQAKRMDIGDLVNETLELMERFGGKQALGKIKHFVPTYESCMHSDKAAPPPQDLRPTTPYHMRGQGSTLR
jgi:hypothetical protein